MESEEKARRGKGGGREAEWRNGDCREFKTVSESCVDRSILKSQRVVMRVGRGIYSFSHLQTSRERHGAQLPQLTV